MGNNGDNVNTDVVDVVGNPKARFFGIRIPVERFEYITKGGIIRTYTESGMLCDIVSIGSIYLLSLKGIIVAFNLVDVQAFTMKPRAMTAEDDLVPDCLTLLSSVNGG